MLTVFGVPKTRGTRITWMLEELGVSYEFYRLDFEKGTNRSPDYLEVNPSGKVPALKDGDDILLESGAIVTYLGDKFPQKNLVPKAGTISRGHHDQWCYFAQSELEQALWTMGKHKFAIPAEHRVTEVIQTAEWEFQQALELLSQGLGDKPYILGEEFSAADIMLGHTLFWALSFKQSVRQQNLKNYIDRLRVRPALEKAWKKELG
ncbi:MAG: glutathione S-transferase family protein [Cellvibrionaceae bacterium]